MCIRDRHKRASSLRRTKEAEKEVTSVEDVETVVREEARGGLDLQLWELIKEDSRKQKEEMNEKFDNIKGELNKIKEELKEDNQKLSQQMAEKMDEQKQDSQRNMEILNEKMAENNEKMNKKIEEEMAGVRQEISEVQGRLETANQEVRQVKTCLLYTSRCV